MLKDTSQVRKKPAAKDQLPSRLARARCFLISSLLVAQVVAACLPFLTLESADTRVSLLTGEHWEASIEVALSQDDALLFTSQIEQALSQAAADLRSQGVEAEWKRTRSTGDDVVVYVLSGKGQGLDSLNAAFFDGKATLYPEIESNQRQIVFQYQPQESALPQARRQTFTLTGGKIISSNGTQLDGRTVTWVNPTSTIRAVLTEKPRFEVVSYLLIASGSVLFIVSLHGLVKRRAGRHRAQASMQTQELLRHCTNCGMPLAAQADFCPGCGVPQPKAKEVSQ